VSLISPNASKPIERPLDAFTFEALAARQYQPSPITPVSTISDNDEYTAQVFAYMADGQKITGQMNTPKNTTGKLPAIIMIRGFVDPSIYQTGVGTKPAAAYFAQNGFATFAPDFLGYSGSDPEDPDVFAARVKRPIAVLTLIESVKKLPNIDPDHIFIWGHSNGGQIALSILEITGKNYPTVLWAPVSKPFPYSVLYYTDDSDDQGKGLRKELAKFETLYNTDLYSLHPYWRRIAAPVQIHQGSRDDAIPRKWTDDLVKNLKLIKTQLDEKSLEINYYTYPSSDHNLRPDWNTVVARDVEFYKKHLN
jgi:dipeptidyl aminopeptidase/acylaminoacyl peptidase